MSKENGKTSPIEKIAAVNTVYEENKSNLSDVDADTGAMLEIYRAQEE